MIPREDNFEDILGKAIKGQGLKKASVAEEARLSPDALEQLLAGHSDESAVRALALPLQLDPEALVRMGQSTDHPTTLCPRSIVATTTDFGDMTVNAYILWDHVSRDCAIFDTGTDAAPLLATIKKEKLNPLAIFLTHSHADHIHALATLKSELEVEAWSSEFEPVRGTKTFRPGDFFNAGQHFIRTRHTSGHSVGGTTFLIEGSTVQAAIVGDAIFAGSVGGIRQNYHESLESIRREILSLPDETVLCPGHGPLTSVAQEKSNNPFFPKILPQP